MARMGRRPFGDMSCSVARTVDVLGERWTPLIIRDIMIGVRRFDVMQRNLGISRRLLSERLEELVGHGVIERIPYQDNPPRYDYVLTEKGVDLVGVLLAMKAWGDRWTAGDEGPPMVLRHDRCGAIADSVQACSECGEPLLPWELTPMLGPGADPRPGTIELHAVLAGVTADED